MDLIRDCKCKTDFEKEHSLKKASIGFLEAARNEGIDIDLHGFRISWDDIISAARASKDIKSILNPSKEDFKGVQKDQLGAGSFGSVYKVVHKANPGFHVAMKVVQFNSESAQREAKALTSLDHPHIVQCYNSFESIDDFHKAFYIIMEFCDTTVQNLMPELRGNFSRVYDLMQQMSSASKYLAMKQQIHRDISPANILVVWRKTSGAYEKDELFNHRDTKTDMIIYNQRPFYKLGDFGCVKDLSLSGRSWESMVTQTKQGTLRYMAPEIREGEQQFRREPAEARRKFLVKYNSKADAWSFGAIFQECMYGDPLVPSFVTPGGSYIQDYALPRLLRQNPSERSHLHELDTFEGEWQKHRVSHSLVLDIEEGGTDSE